MGTILSANEVKYLLIGSGNSGLALLANQSGVTIELINPGTTTTTTTVGVITKAVKVTLRHNGAAIVAIAEEVRLALSRFVPIFFADTGNQGDGSGVVTAFATTSIPYPSAFPSDIVSPNPGEIVRAGGGVGTEFVIYGNTSNGDIRVIAKIANIRLRLLGGISQTLDVNVNGGDLDVQLGTNGAGTVTSTAQAVVNEINGDAAAFALVTASFGGDGSGLASVLANYMAISAGPLGSVRPPLEALTSRTSILNLLWRAWRTFRGLSIDGIGNLLNDVPAGELQIRKAPGTSPKLRITFGKLQWINVDSEGQPSASYTPQPNELCAKNTCKAWFSATTNGSGGWTILDSWNINSVNVDSSVMMSWDYKRAMLDTHYAVSFCGTDPTGSYPLAIAILPGDHGISNCAGTLRSVGAGAPTPVLSNSGYHVTVIIFGNQVS